MSKHKIVIGTRGSKLALWQTEWVKSELERIFTTIQIDVKIIKTTGDKILDAPLSKIGDKGLFTREIEQALLDHRIDAAVHSLKDLPTELPDGLTIGAISKREDVRDVFVASIKKSYTSFDEVPQGGTIATSSLRRKSQLLHWRPDLTIVDVRGNLNTRLAKLDESEWDGMLLARAGVVRLGFDQRITDTLPLERMLPAVGQGALAIEIREDDEQNHKYFLPLQSGGAYYATSAERSLLRYLEGGCQIPIGAYGHIEENTLHLEAFIGSLDGKKIYRGKIHGPQEKAESLGANLAQTLLDSGGKAILDAIRVKQSS